MLSSPSVMSAQDSVKWEELQKTNFSATSALLPAADCMCCSAQSPYTHTHRLAATVCVCLFVCVRVSSGQKLALSSILLSLSPCRSQSRTELRGSWKSLVHALCCNPPLLVTGMVCSTPLTCQLLSASLCVCVSLLSCAHQRTYPSNPARTLYTQSQTTHHPAPISPLLCNPVSDPSPSIERATFHWLATRRFYCSGFVTQLTSLPVFTIC